MHNSHNKTLMFSSFFFGFHSLFYFHLIRSGCIGQYQPKNDIGDKESRWDGELRVQRLPFKCEETVLCGISILFYFCLHSTSCHSHGKKAPVISHSTFLFLHCPPFLCWFFPNPILTCHLSSSSSPSPFRRAFPPIEIHTPQVSSCPYTPWPSLGGFAMVTGRMDDRQGQTLLRSSSSL